MDPLSDLLRMVRLDGAYFYCVEAAEPWSVSTRHARMFSKDGTWFVEDLGSTNGTEINGKRVNRHRLTPGDRLVLGETTLEFRRP